MKIITGIAITALIVATAFVFWAIFHVGKKGDEDWYDGNNE